MAERELEFTTRLTREDVAGVIEAFIEGLKDGRLVVKKSGETLELEVPRVVDLEIEAKINDERAEFEIEISWRTNRAENPDNPPEDGPALPAAKAKSPARKTAQSAAKGAAQAKAPSGTKTAKSAKTPAKPAAAAPKTSKKK